MPEIDIQHGNIIGKETEESPDFAVTVKKSSVTWKRVPATYIDDRIEKPGVPRANLAVSTEKPHGDEHGKRFKDYVSQVNATNIILTMPDCLATTRSILGPRRG
jgi:hypothetical protein